MGQDNDTEEVEPMEALKRSFILLCKQYDQMGQQLAFMSEVMMAILPPPEEKLEIAQDLPTLREEGRVIARTVHGRLNKLKRRT